MKGNEKSTDVLTLEYHGPRVELGRMDSYQVGIIILAFTDFLGIAAKNSLGERIELQTEIQGIREGSFNIEVFLEIVSTAMLISTSTPLKATDIFNLIKESIKVWIHLKGLQPKEIRQRPDNIFQIENQDSQLIYVAGNVKNMVVIPKAGEAARAFIGRPLNNGLTHLDIKSKVANESEIIKQEYAPYFKPIGSEESGHIQEIRMMLLVESPIFMEGKKWRFFDGESRFFADIQDENFLRSVNLGKERFGKGDKLDASVRISQFAVPELKMERSIIKVFEHTEGAEQKTLAFGQDLQ